MRFNCGGSAIVAVQMVGEFRYQGVMHAAGEWIVRIGSATNLVLTNEKMRGVFWRQFSGG